MSAIALMISCLGFVVSYLSYWRVSKREQPHVWMEIQPIGVANCWLASIHLTNPTKYVLKFGKVGVRIQRVPVDDRQDFILGNFQEALAECNDGHTELAVVVGRKDRYLSMSPPADYEPIQPGSTGVYKCLLFRGRLSTAAKVKLEVGYLVMDKKPHSVQTTAYGSIPAPGLTIHLKRV